MAIDICIYIYGLVQDCSISIALVMSYGYMLLFNMSMLLSSLFPKHVWYELVNAVIHYVKELRNAETLSWGEYNHMDYVYGLNDLSTIDVVWLMYVTRKPGRRLSYYQHVKSNHVTRKIRKTTRSNLNLLTPAFQCPHINFMLHFLPFKCQSR